MSWKELSFDVTKGATLIDGWNEDDQRSEGSGKSAVLNAICWAVYGKLPKDVNVDDVVKDGESSCAVVLEFDNGDAIVRTRKPNDLYISKGGITVKGKDARETQQFIEEFIGCNFETFCQSVYFAQNYDKKFLSSNQEDKGKILSSIQNLQIFDKARKEASDLLKLEEAKIIKLNNEVQVQQNSINNFQSQKALVASFIQDKVQKHQAQVKMMNQSRDILLGNLKKVDTDIDDINVRLVLIDLEALSKDEIELNQVKSEYNTQLSGITYQKSQVDTVKKAIASKQAEGQNLAMKYNNIEKKLEISRTSDSPRIRSITVNRDYAMDPSKNTSRTRVLAKVKQLEDFIANPTKTCPSCGTELATADTSHSENELKSIRAEIAEIDIQIAAQVEDFNRQIEQEKQNILAEEANLQAELGPILEQIEVIRLYLTENQVPSVSDLNAQETEIRGVISQIDQALFETQQKKMEHAKLTNQIKSLNDQIGIYGKQLELCEDQIKLLGEPDVSQDQAKLEALDSDLWSATVNLQSLTALVDSAKLHSQRLETLKDGFKEIKSYVFTNALNELNFRTNQYLNDLFEMEATIKFSNDDQKIESKITLGGMDRSLGLLSGGQNRRFNLAVDLALSDIVSYRKTSKLDLLIFDEYFKDLSEISMEKALDLLKSRKCPVILIEHNSLFKNIVDNTFFVRLQDGTSRQDRA